jgi:pyruvate/2-oxoglutarate/acetoin dehydrogenase E1 component
VPGLRVIAPCNLYDPGKLLTSAILESDDPVLFIENKLLYPLAVLDMAEQDEFSCTINPPERETGHSPAPHSPTITLSVKGAPAPMLTIAAYGYMAELARQAVLRLAYEEEIFAELVAPTQLNPFEIEPLLASLQRTGHLLVVEEATLSLGWGAEILARCFEQIEHKLKTGFRLGAAEHAVPASGPMEQEALPQIEDILKAARRVCQKG